MDVTLVGEDPATDAVATALDDIDVRVARRPPSDVGDPDLAIVTGVAGDDAFVRVNDGLDDTPWLSVEIGGLGGVGLDGVDAGIAIYGASCFDCLRERVQGRADVPTAEPSAERSAVRLAGATAGHEAVTLLSGNRSALDSVVEIPHTRRPLLPVPDCCGPPSSRWPETDYEPRDLEATAAAAERAVDERVGPVTAVGEIESFPAPYYLATTAETEGFSDGSVPDQAAGVDDDWNGAYVKAVGEALERYAAAIYRTDRLVHAPPADVDDPIPPAEFAGASDDAPNASDGTAERYWIEGRALGTDRRVSLPAQSVLFPPPASPDIPSITTGLGLGSSPAAALLSGLTEVVERDATMLAWYSTFEPLGLAVDDDRFDRLRRRARSEGLTVTPLLVTQDVDVPVVTVAVHRDGSWPQFAVGSAASLSPIEAANSALAEAIQNWMELRSAGADDVDSLPGAIGRYASFPPAAQAMVDVDDRIPAASVGPENPPTGEDALETLLDRIAAADLDAYATRLTTRDLESLGFEGVRVVVPAAQPLFTGNARFGDRAETVPGALGFDARLDREHHPYP